jgi:uridine phosphorylase
MRSFLVSKSLYLKSEPDEIGDYVLLTGDPARVDRIAGGLESPRNIAQNREFYVVTGTYKGHTMSAVSSGIGAPSAAIAIHELKQLGARAIVRVGTMMGVNAPMGSFVISTGAARYEGTSAAYLPLAYPAVPDWSLVQQLHQGATARQLDIRMGITATYDAFYPQMAPSLVGHGELDLNELNAAGVLTLDMETSLLYILGQRLGLATASMCLVTNTAAPFKILNAAARDNNEDTLIACVLDGLTKWGEQPDE